jgi:hypothetical protein
LYDEPMVNGLWRATLGFGRRVPNFAVSIQDSIRSHQALGGLMSTPCELVRQELAWNWGTRLHLSDFRVLSWKGYAALPAGQCMGLSQIILTSAHPRLLDGDRK